MGLCGDLYAGGDLYAESLKMDSLKVGMHQNPLLKARLQSSCRVMTMASIARVCLPVLAPPRCGTLPPKAKAPSTQAKGSFLPNSVLPCPG